MSAKRFYEWQAAGVTDDVMRFVDYPERADIPWCAIGGVAAVHAILLRMASLHDTLAGKIKAWKAIERRPSKHIKDLGDISLLVESHPELWGKLPQKLQNQIERPE